MSSITFVLWLSFPACKIYLLGTVTRTWPEQPDSAVAEICQWLAAITGNGQFRPGATVGNFATVHTDCINHLLSILEVWVNFWSSWLIPQPSKV